VTRGRATNADPQTLAALARVSVAVVLGRWDDLERLRAEARAPGRAWREAVLQVSLFAGFPRTVEAFRILARAGGLGRPDADEVEPAADADPDGAAIFDTIYDKLAGEVRAELERYHPALARWIADHAYARVLTRPGLSLRDRELLSVACLAALDQPRQLASHARGARRAGASAADVEAVLDSVAEALGPERARRAREVCAEYALD